MGSPSGISGEVGGSTVRKSIASLDAMVGEYACPRRVRRIEDIRRLGSWLRSKRARV
jgi:hypothetical protein